MGRKHVTNRLLVDARSGQVAKIAAIAVAAVSIR